jgi:hypothetical protein
MSRYTNEDIRIDMDWDPCDAWGSVQGALFDLCDAWYLSSGECLAGYRPSFNPNSGLSWRAKTWIGFMDQGDITKDQVNYWFKVLNRLQGLVKLAGREY